MPDQPAPLNDIFGTEISHLPALGFRAVCPTRTAFAALLNVLNCVETRENCVDLPLYDATTATLWTFGFFAPPDF